MRFTFDQKTHTYMLDGAIIPSVTQVICDAGIADFEFMEKRRKDILDRSQKFGRAVHKMIELYNKEILDMGSVDAPLIPYLEGWKRMEEMFGLVIEKSEQMLPSLKHRFAGTIDIVAQITKGKLAGRRAIIDIKSGCLQPAVMPQIGGYMVLWNENFPKSRVRTGLAIQLTDNPDGARVKVIEDRVHQAGFLSCLSARNYKKIINVLKKGSDQ